MLRRISKLTFFIQFLIFLAVAAVFWIPEFIHPSPPIRLSGEGPLYGVLADFFKFYPYLSVSFTLLMVMGLSLILFYIGSVNDILPTENFITAILYLFLLSWNAELLSLNPILPATILIILSIYSIMRLYGQVDPYKQVFSASAAIGLASLFYLPCMYFLFLVWMSLVSYRITSWREWIIALIGFVIPFIYLLSWNYWNDIFISGAIQILSALDDPGLSITGIKPMDIYWLIPTLLLLLISLSAVINVIQDKLISIRRKTIIQVNYMFVCVVMIVLSGSPVIIVSQMLFMPLAFFFSVSLSWIKRGIVLDILMSLYLLFLVFIRFFIHN